MTATAYNSLKQEQNQLAFHAQDGRLETIFAVRLIRAFGGFI
jgi:hypothetical protein